jgi:hypothetical protein
MNYSRWMGMPRLTTVSSMCYARLRFRCMAMARLAICVGSLIIIQMLGVANAQAPGDDSLRIYAVNVAKTRPFKDEAIGYGIYLGQGTVLTAAHVVGHWPFFTRPRVLVAGLDLPAKVLKNALNEQTDLALLAVDEARLPVSLRLRRNPLCHRPPMLGMEVIDVVPERTSRTRIISALSISPALRNNFDTLVDNVEVSGSGIFDAQRKCLLGIASAKVVKFKNQMQNGHVVYIPAGFAGYFVSAAKIAKFLPENLHP